MPGGPGFRSSTTSRPSRLALWRSHRPIRRSSTSAAAKVCSGLTCPSATESTSRLTAGGRGHISACATRQQIPKSRSIHTTPIAMFVAAWAIPTDRMRNGDLPIDRWRTDIQKVLFKDENIGGKDVDIDPSIRTSYTRRSGKIVRGRGRTPPGAGPAAASSSPPMVDRRGRSSPRDCRRSAARESWRSRRPTSRLYATVAAAGADRRWGRGSIDQMTPARRPGRGASRRADNTARSTNANAVIPANPDTSRDRTS